MSRELLRESYTMLLFLPYTASENKQARRDLLDRLNDELAKPEQEPVAWRNAAIRLGEDLYSVGPNGYYDMTAKQWLDWALSVVNTAPPRKEWVGLTDYDLNPLVEKCAKYYGYEMQPVQTAGFYRLADAISAKLKEKNGAL